MAIQADNIDKLVESIVHGAQEQYVTELTDALIDDLINGAFTGKDRQSLETLRRANAKRLQTVLMKHAKQIDSEIMTQVQSELNAADASDVYSLKAIYGAVAKGSTHADEIAYQTARGLKDIINRQNIALEKQAEATWYEVTGEAVTSVNTGLVTEDKAIANAVVQLTDAGITTIDYVSGVSNNIDVAVRRHLVTQVSQAGGDMTLARMKQYGHKLVLVSAHYGARPSHDLWQGKPYSLSGRQVIDGKVYQDFYRATEYGSVTGLKGVNCRHSFGPYYPGITKLPDTNFHKQTQRYNMSSKDYYEATQRQREIERRIRKTKREISGLENAGVGLESTVYTQKRLVLGQQQKLIREHCEKNNLQRIPKREKAYGVSKQPIALSKTL